LRVIHSEYLLTFGHRMIATTKFRRGTCRAEFDLIDATKGSSQRRTAVKARVHVWIALL
jgi:hypothetical protein